MRYLSGSEEKKALEYLTKVTQIALSSTCERSRCGSIIVQNDEIRRVLDSDYKED